MSRWRREVDRPGKRGWYHGRPHPREGRAGRARRVDTGWESANCPSGTQSGPPARSRCLDRAVEQRSRAGGPV